MQHCKQFFNFQLCHIFMARFTLTSREPNFMPFDIETTFWSKNWFHVSFFKKLKTWQHCTQIFMFQLSNWLMALPMHRIRCRVSSELHFGLGSDPKYFFSKTSKSGNTAHNSFVRFLLPNYLTDNDAFWHRNYILVCKRTSRVIFQKS